MSFYQDYRPQNFSDLIGQEDVAETLRSQFASGKFSHAYIFIGPKGTGKTTVARIIAKAVNCSNLKDGDPDNKCVNCQSITAGANLDVIEIDAASNRGIEEIRDLREKIKLSPTHGQYKVYIIDEVHMLTTEAFNALLKTLEEPPKHAVFILCTTEAHKVPATILSRCQRFEFKPASADDLETLVKKVAKKESLELDKDAASAIAKNSDHSYRDALTLLEQVSSSGMVTPEKIGKVTRRSGEARKLLELIEAENSVASIEFINNVHAAGGSIFHLTSELINLMREELLLAVKSSNDVRQIKLVQLVRILSRAYTELKNAVLPTLPLELAVIEAVGTKERIVAEVVQEVVQEAVREETGAEKTEDSNPEPTINVELEDLRSNWDRVLRAIKPLNHSLEAFLRGCEPYEVSAKLVTLKFFYKFHKDMVDQAKNKQLVEKELTTLMGKEIKVKTILGEKSEAKKIRTEEVKNVEEVGDEDLVQKAVDIFNSGVS